MRTEDMLNSITNPKDKMKVAKKRGKSVAVRYNVNGENDLGGKITVPDDQCCAYELTNNGQTEICRVVVDKRGDVFNPLRVGFGYSLAGKDKTSGNDAFKFRETTKSAFDLYVKFLKTRSENYLLSAEREMRSNVR